MIEYEKYQELQSKSQKMQEDYERQLAEMEESKEQAPGGAHRVLWDQAPGEDHAPWSGMNTRETPDRAGIQFNLFPSKFNKIQSIHYTSFCWECSTKQMIDTDIYKINNQGTICITEGKMHTLQKLIHNLKK